MRLGKMKEKKNGFIYGFNRLFSIPITYAMTGFGVFWLYRLGDINVFVSMVVGLYVTAITAMYGVDPRKSDKKN